MLALPGVANGATFRFGSSLTAPANKVETHPVDSVFWAKALPNGATFRVPAKGRVSKIKLKGSIVNKGGSPNTLIHFQILHPIPNSGGKVKVDLTSGPFHVPVGGDPNHISTYNPVHLCARKGDFVAFSNVGGYKPPKYPNGTPYRVFSSNVMGASTNFFTKKGGDNNGDVLTGTAHPGEELLMRMVLESSAPKAEGCQNR